MPRPGFRMLAKVIFCTMCVALAGTWPSQGNQSRGDQREAQRIVAVGSERIERGRHEVRILRGNQPVDLPRFRELLVANVVGPEAGLESFYGRQVTIVRSLKGPGRWEVYLNAVAVGGLLLAENVYELKKVISSPEKAPIEVYADGKALRLGPGQVLLVLG